MDQLDMANSVHWQSHVLRREDGHVLGREISHLLRKEGYFDLTSSRKVQLQKSADKRTALVAGM